VSGHLVIRGGTVITMNPSRDVERADVVIADGQIVGIGDLTRPVSADVLDASGCLVLPGFIQAHTHLCQTLCRGRADDLPLLAWLKERVWPYEAALDAAGMRAAARLACAELLLGGTTAILDMGTVHETDALFDAVAATGLRATIGKAMMDIGDGVPPRLREDARASLTESDALRGRWDRAHGGRMRYAYAPRFALSCSDGLLREVGARVSDGARVHTHASEQEAEIAIVRKQRGQENIAYMEDCGLFGPRATLAHCVHATPAERVRLAATGTHVVHCPSSNLKLGSGIAPIPEMLAQGINVALGADGAPCNNNLDALLELRLAALLHTPRVGPGAFPASRALELLTLGGARALGLVGELGSIEPGKRADLVILSLGVHARPQFDPVSAVVYAAQSRDVRDVLVDGRVLVRDRQLTELTGLDLPEVVHTAEIQAERLAART
jgi:cytosine/adenosine deaminase-related metal-dependent hydrolase